MKVYFNVTLKRDGHEIPFTMLTIKEKKNLESAVAESRTIISVECLMVMWQIYREKTTYYEKGALRESKVEKTRVTEFGDLDSAWEYCALQNKAAVLNGEEFTRWIVVNEIGLEIEPNSI